MRDIKTIIKCLFLLLKDDDKLKKEQTEDDVKENISNAKEDNIAGLQKLLFQPTEDMNDRCAEGSEWSDQGSDDI